MVWVSNTVQMDQFTLENGKTTSITNKAYTFTPMANDTKANYKWARNMDKARCST